MTEAVFGLSSISFRGIVMDHLILIVPICPYYYAGRPISIVLSMVLALLSFSIMLILYPTTLNLLEL